MLSRRLTALSLPLKAFLPVEGTKSVPLMVPSTGAPASVTSALHLTDAVLIIIRQCRIFLVMLFIETSTFTKLLSNYLTDEEYRGLQSYLLQKPDAGDLIKGSGGVRKVRWAPAGSGKSGGIRAIYYWKKSDHEIWMLTLYSKSERASIPGHTLKQIAEAIKNG